MQFPDARALVGSLCMAAHSVVPGGRTFAASRPRSYWHDGSVLSKSQEPERRKTVDVTAKKRAGSATEWNTLSQAAVARMMGVTTTRVGQWIADGRLPAHRVPGWARLRVFRRDAEHFERERKPRIPRGKRHSER